MPPPPAEAPAPPAVIHYAELLDQQYPGFLSGTDVTLAGAYIAYMAQHPKANPRVVYLTIIARLKAFGEIPKGIAASVGAVGKLTGEAATGAGDAVTFHSGILGFLGRLTEAHTWVRVAEFVVGAILVAVGLNALLKQSTGIDVAKAVPKVVPV